MNGIASVPPMMAAKGNALSFRAQLGSGLCEDLQTADHPPCPVVLLVQGMSSQDEAALGTNGTLGSTLPASFLFRLPKQTILTPV